MYFSIRKKILKKTPFNSSPTKWSSDASAWPLELFLIHPISTLIFPQSPALLHPSSLYPSSPHSSRSNTHLLSLQQALTFSERPHAFIPFILPKNAFLLVLLQLACPLPWGFPWPPSLSCVTTRSRPPSVRCNSFTCLALFWTALPGQKAFLPQVLAHNYNSRYTT